MMSPWDLCPYRIFPRGTVVSITLIVPEPMSCTSRYIRSFPRFVLRLVECDFRGWVLGCVWFLMGEYSVTESQPLFCIAFKQRLIAILNVLLIKRKKQNDFVSLFNFDSKVFQKLQSHPSSIIIHQVCLMLSN